MYTKALKKLGEEFGMQPVGDRILGEVEGLSAAMFYTMGVQVVSVAMNAAELGDVEALMTQPRKKYGISKISAGVGGASFFFQNTYVTIKRMRAFLQTELPAFAARGLGEGIVCPHCDRPVGVGDARVMLDDELALMHADCVETFEQQLDRDWEIQKHEAKPAGSGVLGFVGAFVGGLIGTIPWIVLGVVGFIASIGGSVIALCANYGHKKLGGRPGRSRVATVVIVTVLMVAVASVLSQIASVSWMVVNGDMDREFGLPAGSIRLGDFLKWYFPIAVDDPEARSVFFRNLAMGYLFAGLGLSGVLRGKMRDENKSGNIAVKRLSA